MDGGKAVRVWDGVIYGTMGISEFSVLSALFCCEPQTLKKIKSIKKKNSSSRHPKIWVPERATTSLLTPVTQL